MAKTKISVVRPKVREVKKHQLREIKKEAEEPREDIEEKDGEQKFEFLEGETGRAGKAPVLEPAQRRDELESILSKVQGVSEKENTEEKEEIKYGFEKPKYSFSDGGNDAERRGMEELRPAAPKELPPIIHRTEEARDLQRGGLHEQMLETSHVEEYSLKYVEPHRQNILKESEELKGRSADVRKYRRER